MEMQTQQYLSQLAEDPSKFQVMDSLERLFGAEGRWSELAALLVDQAQEASDAEVRAGLLARAGEILALYQQDLDSAEVVFLEAAAGDHGAGAAIAGLYLKGDWKSVVEIYRQGLGVNEEHGAKVALLCRMGFIFRDQLDDDQNAMKAFQAAFRLDKSCLVALRSAREIYSRVGNWKLVAQLLQFELQALQGQQAPPGTLSTTFTELGEVLRVHLGSADVARNCYNNALKLNPENEAAIRGLLYLNGELVDESVDASDPSAAEEAPEEAAPVAEEAAVEAVAEASADEAISEDIEVEEAAEAVSEDVEVAEEAASGDAEEVAEASADEAISEDIEVAEAAEEAVEASEDEAVSEDIEVEEAAEEAVEASADEAVSEDIEVAEAAEAVSEDVVEAAEAVSEDIEVAEAAEEAASGDAEEVAEASADEAAEAISEDIEVAEAAEEAVEASADEAVSEDIEVEEAAEEVAAAPAQETWADKAEGLVAAGEYYEAMVLHANNAPRRGGLASLMGEVLGAAPDSEAHYEKLRGRFSDKSAWGVIHGLLEARFNNAEGEARGALGRQLGRVKLYEQGDLAGAMALAESLQGEGQLGSFSEEIQDARAAEGGAWRRLQQELTSRYEDLDSGARARAVYGRMAELGRAFGQNERRLDALRHLVNEAPEDREARQDLKALYGEEGKWQNVVELIKQEVDLAADDDEAMGLLWEMVGIYRDQLGLDVMVINTLNQILGMEPDNLAVMDQLAAQYDKMRRYPDLVSVLQKRADATSDDKERLGVFLQVAHLFTEKFSNQVEAIKAYENVMEIDPYHKEALEFLKPMYERRREYDKLIEISEREISQLATDEEKGAAYKDIADKATKWRRVEQAGELWGKVLQYSPKDLEALNALEVLYERNKDWDALVDVGERKLDLIDDDQEKVKLAEKLGRFYGDRMDRPEDAARCWRRVLAIEPSNRRAQDSLKKILIDAQDWDGLGEFFDSQDDHNTHVRTLETLGGTIKEDEVKVELLFRAAKVWQDKLDKVDRAVRSLEKIHTIDETNERAARMLVPIYREAGDSRKLAGALEIVLGHINPEAAPEDARETLKALAGLNEQELRNPEVAFLYYARAFALEELGAPSADDAVEIDVDDDGVDVDVDDDGQEPPAAPEGPAAVTTDAFADLERVAEGLGAWDDLVGVYSDKLGVLEEAGEVEAMRELRLRIGRILNAELGRTSEALEYFEQVLAVFPEELRALDAEEAIFQKTGDWDRLLEVYDRKLVLTEEPAARIALLRGKALILEESQGDAAGAVECHLEVLDLEPENMGALQALHRLYEGLEDYDALAGVLRREIALNQLGPLPKGVDGRGLSAEEAAEAGVLAEGASLETLVSLKHQLGLVAAQGLGDADARQEAVGAFRDVLAMMPDNADALMSLEELGRDGVLALEVANTLEVFYAETGRWESLVQAREVQLAEIDPDEIDAREAKLLSIGETLVGELGDPERAFDAYARALREKPTSEVAMAQLEAIAEATDAWAPLVELWEGIIPELIDPALNHGYQTRVARGYEMRLGEPGRAQMAWRRVLELEPEDRQALERLESLYMDGQQWHELDEIYLRMLSIQITRNEAEEAEHGAVGQDSARALRALRFKRATLHEEMLDDAPGAIEIYQSVLDLEPRNLRACQAMDRLLLGEGRHEELAQNLEQQLALVEDPSEKLDLKVRLAGLREKALYDVAGAIELYGAVLIEAAELTGEVLGDEPSAAGALEALEELLRGEPDHQLVIAGILEPLYEQAGAWEQLIETLEIRLGATADVAERVALLHAIAGLYEARRGDLASAFTTLTRALREDVTHGESMEGLYRLADAIDGWEALVEALESEVARTMDVELGTQLNMRIAAIQETRLDDANGAIEHYRRVLELDPEAMAAINELERIFTDLAMWADLVEVLLRKVPLVAEADAQKELLHRAATLYEDMLEDEASAVEVLERVLIIDEADALAIERLEGLYRAGERWMELIDLYGRKLRLTEDDNARRDLFFLIGGLYESEIQDADRAIETYRAVLEIDPRDGDALRKLDALYTDTEQWSYLLEALERQLELAQDPSEALALRHRAGELWERHMGDPVRAVEVYRGILEEAPDFVLTIEALEGMVDRGEEQAAAAAVLGPIYRDSGQWDRLIELYEVMVGGADGDVLAQAGLLKEIGQIQELRREDPASAFEAYGRALRLDSEDDGVLETLERLASELEHWEGLVELLEDQVSSIHDMEVARTLSLRIGRILEEEIFDRGRAIDRFRMVLDIEPSDQVAINALDRLYEKEGRWEELAQILLEEIIQEEDDEARTRLRFRLGNLYEQALEDVPQAIATYHEIMMGEPEHEGARQALERMFSEGWAPMEIGGILGPWYEERGHWGALVGVYEVQLEHREDSSERFLQIHQIVDIYREHLQDDGQAFMMLGRALVERPGDESTIEQLEALAEALGGWEQLAGFYYNAIERAGDPDDQRVLMGRIAAIMDHRLGDVVTAEEAYLQVLGMDETNLPALVALDRIYEQQARWQELAQIIESEIGLTLDEQEVVTLSYRLGTLFEHQLGDLDRAVETYNRLLDIQPTHPEALQSLEGIYQLREEWEPLFDIYQRQADLLYEDQAGQAEVYAKMAALADQTLMRPLDSIDLWNRVLDLRTEDPMALEALAGLHEREGQWGELVMVLERQVAVTPDPDMQMVMWLRAGRIWREHLLNDDRSLEAYRAVLGLDPSNVEALLACRAIYHRMGDYEALVGVIDQLIMDDSLPAEDQRELYIQLGEIQGDLLRNIPEAVQAWTAVLSLDPTYRPALDSLEQLYLEGEQWEAGVDILGRKVELLEMQFNDKYAHLRDEEGLFPDECYEDGLFTEQIELQLRIADMWETRIGNPDNAVLAYEAVLELDPSHAQASRALEGLYTDRGEWQKLVDLLLVRQEYTEDEFEGVELLRTAARLYEERLDAKEAAFLVLCRAFMENHEDEATAADLERLAREAGQWETLINLYYNVLEQMGDGPEALALHMKIARWWADELGDRDRAISHYQTALELGPDNTEVMGALEGIYEKAARWEELVGIMELRAEMTFEDDLRIDLYRRMGDVLDIQLQDASRAIEAYRMILQVDPTEVSALGSLEGIYERNQAWPELIEVLERKSEVIFEPEQVVEIKARIAQLWEVEVGSVERAVDAYRAVLGIEQTHWPSLEALERLYQHLEKWYELQEVYNMQLMMAQEPEAQVAIYLKAAVVYEVELQDAPSAIECYGKILLVDPHNLQGIEQLERLYASMELWDDLYQTYERHVEAVMDSATKVVVYQAMGQVCRDHLVDLHRAIEAYRAALELDPTNIEALYDLAQLYETASDWEACLSVYQSLTQVVTDPEAGVELHYRMGRILEENLLDGAKAEERYRFALEIDPSYLPAIESLRGLYERREDWSGVIAMLKQEEEYTRDLEAKAGLLSRIGKIYEEKLGDEIRALDYFEQTIDLAPENVDAAEPLAQMYLREKRWARAWPLLDLLVRHHGHDRTREDLYLLHYNLGLCCEELGQEERALKEYGEAYEYNPGFLPTLMGMGRLLYRRNDLDRAYKIYRTVTRHHAESLTEDQLVDINLHCGEIKRRLGELESAVQMYEAVLQLQPHHVEALKALIEIYGEMGYWEHVVAYRQRQLEVLTEDTEQYAMLIEIGDILNQHLGNPAGAVELYRRALEVKADSVVVLRKLLDIYTQSQMWTDAVAVLTRIMDLEQDPGRKSKYCYTIAVIFRDEVGDVMRSVEFFNRALDNDVAMLKSFEAIDRLLTAQKAWKELERSYRQMLHRIKDAPSTPEMDGLKLLLWKNLGEIYRSRQNNLEAAIQAYRIAANLRPDDHSIHEILADLYERSGNHPEAAIEEHKRLIEMKPFRIESYRALFNAFMKTQRYDEAWCMASALTFLQSAKPKEQEFYQNYLGAGPANPQRALGPDHWKLLYHTEQDMLISNVMALIAVYMRADYYAFDHKTWNIHKRKDLMDLNQQLPFCRIYQWTAQSLGLAPPPQVYLKRDQMAPMRNGNLEPPAFIVGPTLFQNTPDRDVAFIVGRQLALARPEHYLAGGFFPTENLKVLFMAAMKLTNPALNIGANDPNFADVVNRMGKVPPPVLIQLRKFMQQFFQSGRNPNLSAWLKAIDHTSNRVGLLMCGDLLTAANCIKNDQVPISKLTVKEQIKELVLFSISEEYFQLRRDLGLALRTQ